MLIFAFFRPKHPVKVHVWAGISKQGATGICIFQGTVVKELFVDILDKTLLPFIKDIIPQHRFIQDNDPKHQDTPRIGSKRKRLTGGKLHLNPQI